MVFLVALHVIATAFYLYWFYWWLDTVMHLLGGLWTALFVIWLFGRCDFFTKLSFEKRFFFILICVFFVAVSWEVFELILENVDPSMGLIYWLDTFGDVTAGLLGGSLAAVLNFDIKKPSF